MPLPLPLESAIQLVVVAGDQEQPACVATVNEKLPPDAPALALVGFSVYVQFCKMVTASGTLWVNPPPVAVIERL